MARGYWIMLILLSIGIILGWYGHGFYQQRISPSFTHSTTSAAAAVLPDAYTLMKLDMQARTALYQVFLANPDCLTNLSSTLKLQVNAEADMDFPDILAQLHRQAPNGLSLEQLRLLARCIGVDGAEALRMLLNPSVYAQWQSQMPAKSAQ